MYRHMKKTICLLILLAAIYSCDAQDTMKNWNFSVGANFTTVPTLAVSGTDTAYNNSLSVAPFITIRNKNGIGLTYSPKLVAGGSAPGIYMHELTLGIESYDKKKLDYFVDLSHYFFTGNKSIPYTPINNELYSSLTYKKSAVRPMLALGVGFGSLQQGTVKNTVSDVSLTGGISHIFRKEKNGADLALIPALRLNAGTNDYFSLMHSSPYISANKNFKKLMHKKKGNTVITPNTTVSKGNFSLNNIEPALQASYEKGNLSIRPELALAIPVFSNADNGISFLWQLEARYDF